MHDYDTLHTLHRQYFTGHLQTLQLSREKLYGVESQERIRRALRMQPRHTKEDLHLGQTVEYYQKPDSKNIAGWRGPALVTGIGDTVIQARYGGQYLRKAPTHVRVPGLPGHGPEDPDEDDLDKPESGVGEVEVPKPATTLSELLANVEAAKALHRVMLVGIDDRILIKEVVTDRTLVCGPLFNDARMAELQSWADKAVYEPVEYTGQDLITTTWVYTLKNFCVRQTESEGTTGGAGIPRSYARRH